MPRRLLYAALAALLAVPAAQAATSARLTIYHADDDALFSGRGQRPVDAGHALIHERRSLHLIAGTQQVTLDGLPVNADAETMAVAFDSAAGVKVLGQQLRMAHPLADAVGQPVDLVTSDGTRLHGTLLGWAVDTGAILRTADGKVHLLRRYTSMTLPSGSIVDSGILQLRVDTKSAGTRDARLTYMTTGLGWRAAYAATLAGGAACRMRFKPEASIANRSGHAYDDAVIELVAGQPNLGNRARMYSRAEQAAPAPATAMARAMPVEAPLGDYRSFTLAGPVDLPNDTVTLTPLYPAQELACQREYIVEDGGSYFPPHPNLNDYGAPDYRDRAVASSLSFIAPEALPAGTLRAWLPDRDGAPQLLGEGGIADTPKGQNVAVELGQSFELRASRERTAFHVDATGHTLDEAYAITLTNAGDVARTVTLREHPNRWREWTLATSSRKPAKETPQMLEFEVPVPAHGKATLTYGIRYTWTAQDL